MSFPEAYTMSFMDTLHYLGPRLVVALFCGGLIGLERELKNKSAGIKTNMLICVGSMLFTTTSILMGEGGGSSGGHGGHGDPARIAAQIVSGIGFLGGGAIMQSKETILGLTTAASIWLVAAVGVWIGLGQLEISIFITVLMVFVLVSVTFFENRVLERKRLFKIILHLREKTDEVTRVAIEGLIGQMDLTLEDYRENLSSNQPMIRIAYFGRTQDHSKLVLELWKVPGILEVKQS